MKLRVDPNIKPDLKLPPPDLFRMMAKELDELEDSLRHGRASREFMKRKDEIVAKYRRLTQEREAREANS